MKNRYWSSKHVTHIQGDSMWIRADYVDRLRAAVTSAGRVETGQSLVTGGKTYVEFLLPQAA